MQVVSLNYKNSSLEEREAAWKNWQAADGVILKTCNRVELYTKENDGKSAILHLFKLASGLESQILGESEILGQINKLRETLNDSYLRKIFDQAVKVGRKVRRETGISRGNVSVASVAVTLLGKEKNKKIIVIGSGKVTEAVLKNLAKRGFQIVLVANRTFAKAQKLASIIEAKAIRFKELAEELIEADLVISSTAAPHFVVVPKQIKPRRKPLVLIDLAVPRDIDPAIAKLTSVSLYNIDDIKETISLNLLKRRIEAIKAEKIIEDEMEKFCAKLELATVAVA